MVCVAWGKICPGKARDLPCDLSLERPFVSRESNRCRLAKFYNQRVTVLHDLFMTSVKHLIKENETGRIDLVVQKLTERSRTQVRGLFDHGCVLLNGVVCDNAGERVRASDEVSVHYDKNRNYKELPKKYRSPIFDLIFEDEWILVVDKKAGYLTVPTDHREPNTVVGALCQYMSLGKPKRRLVSIVHRLDRDTSGLLVFAKNEKIAQQIKAQFENRKPLREYLAIVRGRLDSPTGT